MGVSDSVYKLITSIPDFASNPVGTKARKALTNKLQAALPGSHSQTTHLGPPFRDVFFPDYQSVPYESGITSATILNDSFWSDFSVPVLCQSIKHQTSSASSEVNSDMVDADVSGMNQQVTDTAVTWYTYVMFRDFMDYNGDLDSARQVYEEQLNSDHWVTFKTAQYTSGSWDNPDWELFHHWVKLSALGASDEEIDSLIKSLQAKKLPVPSDVGPGKWRSYLVWYSPNTLDHSDVDADAQAGELVAVYMGSGIPKPEQNSHEFMFNGMPGNKYKQPSSSSCLSSNTKVVMSDGTLKVITDVQVGDAIQTPSGIATVRMVSMPKIGTRYVYKINELPFYFTDAHPFLSYSGRSRYLAVAPLKLLNNVPLLGQDGVGQIQVGTGLLAHGESKITVTSLEKITPKESDEYVYDLIIDPSSNGKFEYFAGSEGNLFAIASELSTISNLTTAEKFALEVILKVIQANSEKLETLYTSISDYEEFLLRIKDMARQIKGYFLYAALNIDPTQSNGSQIVDAALAEMLTNGTEMCQNQSGEYSQACGAAYDYFMQILFYPIASSIELGYRVVPQSNSLEYLVISIMEFGVVDAGPEIPTSPIIRVRAPHQAPINEEGDEKTDQMYVRRFHKSYYFAVKTKDEYFEVIIELFGSDKAGGEKSVLLRASQFVSLSLQHGCINWRLPFFDKDQIKQGYVDTEVRFLTASQLDLESTQAVGWDVTRQKELAASIEKVCEDYLGYLCEN